jgi:hypothetical protein
MGRNHLTATRMTNLEPGSRDHEFLGMVSAGKVLPDAAAMAWDPSVERLRREPGFEWLTIDDLKWILFGEHNYLSTYPDYRQGMFTLRAEADPGSHKHTLDHSIDVLHKTHACLTLCGDKLSHAERSETPLYIFWIDLHLARRLQGFAELRRNGNGGRYWLYDWRVPEVRLCARRIEL